jgi:hypothetical protein
MKLYLLISALLTYSMATSAQTTVLSVGNTTALTIKSGVVFSADSLVLKPSADFTLSSNTIQISHTAINMAPAPSIDRVYYLNNQVTFTGTIQLYYQPSELNGNPESALQFTDSAIGSAWLASGSSTVNTASHYVQQVASGLSFNGATASHQGTILALTIISFSGAWTGNGASLQWVVSQSNDFADFDVFRSTDGTTWTNIGTADGMPGNGNFSYAFNDADPPGNQLLYRLEIRDISGLDTWSSIVGLQRAGSNEIKLVAQGKSVSVYFVGAQPDGVRIVNATGQTIRLDRTSRPQYEFTDLAPGVYFFQYEVNGSMGVRSFLIN